MIDNKEIQESKDINLDNLNCKIEEFISLNDEVKKLSESIKETREKIKELKNLSNENKLFIEKYLSDKNLNQYKYKNYEFKIVDKQVNKKPNTDKIHDIIYDEIKTKMEKQKAKNSAIKIIDEIKKGGSENIRKLNIKQIKKQ